MVEKTLTVDRLFYIEGSLVDFDVYIQHAKHQRFSDRLDAEHSDANIEAAKKFARDFYSERRYDYEVGGTSVGDLAVRTDRFTVDRIYQARVLAKEDAAFSTDWKLGDGTFLTLDAPTIIAIGDAVTVHLKDAFTKEKVVNESIDAATTIAELKAITW